jgi:hypothetical protein
VRPTPFCKGTSRSCTCTRRQCCPGCQQNPVGVRLQHTAAAGLVHAFPLTAMCSMKLSPSSNWLVINAWSSQGSELLVLSTRLMNQGSCEGRQVAGKRAESEGLLQLPGCLQHSKQAWFSHQVDIRAAM